MKQVLFGVLRKEITPALVSSYFNAGGGGNQITK